MSENSKIQWCDHTYNPWRGCRKATRINPDTGKLEMIEECRECYIVTTTPFRTTGQKHGSVRVRASESYLKQPLKWNAKPWICDNCGTAYPATMADGKFELCGPCMDKTGRSSLHRARVFCLSLGDWLDDENVPIEWLADLLATICATPNLAWLLLTKRPHNWWSRINVARDYLFRYCASVGGTFFVHDWVDRWMHGNPPSNIWIGISAGADQKAALEIPARIHFLSCEPMLKPMDETHAAKFDWIIFGGESGHKARPCNVDWIINGILFCKQNDIACFLKQLGSRPVQVVDSPMCDLHPLKDSHGGDMEEWPEDLRVREFPEVKP